MTQFLCAGVWRAAFPASPGLALSVRVSLPPVIRMQDKVQPARFAGGFYGIIFPDAFCRAAVAHPKKEM